MCPKCRGNLLIDSDGYGKFLHCLQCGLMKSGSPRPIEKTPDIRGPFATTDLEAVTSL